MDKVSRRLIGPPPKRVTSLSPKVNLGNRLLIGTHRRQIDEKGRISLAVFSDQLMRVALFLVVTKAEETQIKHLKVFDSATWTNIYEGLTDQETQTRFFDSSYDTSLDKAARLTLSQDCRQTANFADNIAVVRGCGRHLEIYQRSDWDKTNSSINEGTLSPFLIPRK
ncbi:MAG: hypothetical protein ABIH50_07855 [bacterium]